MPRGGAGGVLGTVAGTNGAVGSEDVPVQQFPTIRSVNTQGGTNLSTAASFTLPTGAASGDLVIYFISHDASLASAITASTGWAQIATADVSAGAHGMKAFARVLDGTTGDNILDPGGNAQDYTAIGVVITTGTHPFTTGTDLTTAMTIGTASDTNATAIDPANCNPGVSDDYLWLVWGAFDKTVLGQTITAVSANYNLDAGITSNENSTSSYSALGSRQLTASSENPGVFTVSTNRPWAAFTVAVPPA